MDAYEEQMREAEYEADQEAERERLEHSDEALHEGVAPSTFEERIARLRAAGYEYPMVFSAA